MKRGDICRCANCGLQLETATVVNIQQSLPMCCGKIMQLQQENSVEAAGEKHIPVVETLDNGILVKIGSIAHPMTEAHYIEWIEVINGAYVNRCYLKPGDLPQAAFYVPLSPKLVVRASCNIHGLWKKI